MVNEGESVVSVGAGWNMSEGHQGQGAGPVVTKGVVGSLDCALDMILVA